MPDELAIIDTAMQFHVLPDDIENKMSARWWQLWQVYVQEKNRG